MPSWRGNASIADAANHAASTRNAAIAARRDCTALSMGRGSAQDVVLHDAVQRAEAVLVPDLLSLRVRAPVVRDADLEDAATQLRHFRRDLGLEAEPVL